MRNLKNYLSITLLILGSGFFFTACDDDAPEPENPTELITDVTLVFTNTADNSTVTARAVDPDGIGAQPIEVLDDIELAADATYILTYEILDRQDPTDPKDIGEEIEEEADEHQIFYGFTDGAFANPTGNGNIDNAGDPVDYIDQDGNGCNLGLETTWTAGSAQTGTFRVRLQHQPDIKTCSTGANDGDTDFDLTFNLIIS